jgi:polysaccharide export outer membrane protein
MGKMLRSVFKILVIAALFSSCRSLNPSVMFKTKKDFKYAVPPAEPLKEYKISANDVLDFKLYSNDGFKLIDIISLNTDNRGNFGAVYTYKVEFDGTVKLPLIGRVSLEGKTIREAENQLEIAYAKEYVKPYVLLSISNRRVIVFPGQGGAAQVIGLRNDNTTLLEALASAGGISTRGRADRVKLIRGNLKDPQVFLIDLSTIDGVKQADLVLQANDIIYVQPSADVARNLANEIAPYLSILTSVVAIYTYVTIFNK